MGYRDPQGQEILLAPFLLQLSGASRGFVSDHPVKITRFPFSTKKMHRKIGRWIIPTAEDPPVLGFPDAWFNDMGSRLPRIARMFNEIVQGATI
jgi:hypothetical protein